MDDNVVTGKFKGSEKGDDDDDDSQYENQLIDAERENNFTGRVKKYDKEKFYVKSTDSSGHRMWQKLSLPPAYLAQVQILIHSNLIPVYKSPQDFFRDAGIHRLIELEGLLKDREFTESLGMLHLDLKIKEAQAKEKLEQEFVETLISRIKQVYMATRNTKQLADDYAKIKGQLSEEAQNTIEMCFVNCGHYTPF